MRALIEAKRYLWRVGINTDTTVDPVKLLGELAAEFERRLSIDERRVVRRAVNGPMPACMLVSPSK